MSRIAKYPVPLPKGVDATLAAESLSIKGPLGTLTQRLRRDVKIAKEGDTLTFNVADESDEANAMSGTLRALVYNMVAGVTNGFEKKLEIQGVGYRAALKGVDLELSVGYSHTVTIKPRTGITFEVPTPTEIFVKGTDKQMVGQTAAEIRKVRPPEPYKGKGIRYEGEYVRRKVGKRA